jgi:hypothetical protein
LRLTYRYGYIYIDAMNESKTPEVKPIKKQTRDSILKCFALFLESHSTTKHFEFCRRHIHTIRVIDNGTMSDSQTTCSLILPFRKGPQSRTSTHDLEPILWKSRAEESDIERRSTVPCSVCRQNQGRYTCPKCETPYCSVACYKKHSEHEDPSQVCSESFYRDRVAQVLQLEVKENEQETKRMLSRNYVQQQQQEQQLQDDPEIPSDVTEEELHNILAVLEGGDKQELSRLLSTPRLKAAFERSIENGGLHDWFLEPWHPWWRQELVGYDQEQDNNDDDLEENEFNGKTLDERLLEVPSFRSLQPTKKALPDLGFNLVSILYSISWTLRLYHGVENAKHVEMDAASTLVQSSTVLSSDARFNTLEEAMHASVVASTQSYQCGKSGCNTSWNVLAKDVALIYGNRRLVGRALLEAIDIVRFALSALKKEGDAEGASKMRRIRKKIQFYLAWSLEQSTLCAGLPENIEAWINDWRDSDDVEERIELLVPEERAQRAAPIIEQPPLLKEISVKRNNCQSN